MIGKLNCLDILEWQFNWVISYFLSNHSAILYTGFFWSKLFLFKSKIPSIREPTRCSRLKGINRMEWALRHGQEGSLYCETLLVQTLLTPSYLNKTSINSGYAAKQAEDTNIRHSAMFWEETNYRNHPTFKKSRWNILFTIKYNIYV